MTTRGLGIRILASAFFGLIVLDGGCSDGPTLVRRTSEPMLYVILSRDPNLQPAAAPAADSALFGLFATTGTPIAAEYRVPEQLVIRRRSDGVPLSWRVLPLTGSVKTGGSSVSLPAGGNLQLDWIGAPGSLGRRDIAGGDVYDVQVTSDQRTLTGHISVPDTPALRITTVAGVTTVAWQRIPEAAIYLVRAETEFTFSAATADTTYVLHYDAPRALMPPNPRFTLIAVDTNFWNYFKDTLTLSSGITGGYGVLGAISGSTINVPPAATPSAAASCISYRCTERSSGGLASSIGRSKAISASSSSRSGTPITIGTAPARCRPVSGPVPCH